MSNGDGFGLLIASAGALVGAGGTVGVVVLVVLLNPLVP
jgi:hypothetical protein